MFSLFFLVIVLDCKVIRWNICKYKFSFSKKNEYIYFIFEFSYSQFEISYYTWFIYTIKWFRKYIRYKKIQFFEKVRLRIHTSIFTCNTIFKNFHARVTSNDFYSLSLSLFFFYKFTYNVLFEKKKNETCYAKKISQFVMNRKKNNSLISLFIEFASMKRYIVRLKIF